MQTHTHTHPRNPSSNRAYMHMHIHLESMHACMYYYPADITQDYNVITNRYIR